jgi:hypothetical protein
VTIMLQTWEKFEKMPWKLALIPTWSVRVLRALLPNAPLWQQPPPVQLAVFDPRSPAVSDQTELANIIITIIIIIIIIINHTEL